MSSELTTGARPAGPKVSTTDALRGRVRRLR